MEKLYYYGQKINKKRFRKEHSIKKNAEKTLSENHEK